jgi:hypothetical protein
MLIMSSRRYKGVILIPNHRNAHILFLFNDRESEDITSRGFHLILTLEVTEADLFDKTSVNLIF